MDSDQGPRQRKILVCLDGSERAEAALPYALAAARAMGPETEVVLTQVPQPLYLGFHFMPQTFAELASALSDQIARYLQGLADELGKLGCRASVRVPRGEVVPALLALEEKENPDLLVITSHGRTGLVRWMLGSVAERLARHCHSPLLLLPSAATSRARWQLVDPPSFQTALLPLDGSDVSEAALEFRRLVPLGSERVCLLTATDPPENLGLQLDPRDLDGLMKGLEGYLVRHSDAPGLAGCQVTHRACHLKAADAILSVAADVGADFIVMATQGRSGLSRLMLGSVAEKVARGSDRPVLLIKPLSVPAVAGA